MRPTPIYDELAARQRAGAMAAGPPPEQTPSVLSFPARPATGSREELPQRRPRHQLRRG